MNDLKPKLLTDKDIVLHQELRAVTSVDAVVHSAVVVVEDVALTCLKALGKHEKKVKVRMYRNGMRDHGSSGSRRSYRSRSLGGQHLHLRCCQSGRRGMPSSGRGGSCC